MNLQQGSIATASLACPGLTQSQPTADDLHDPAPHLFDFVRIGAGLFKGCSGVVRHVESGPTGLVTVSVYVSDQERWTDQPYADSDFTIVARVVDGELQALMIDLPATA